MRPVERGLQANADPGAHLLSWSAYSDARRYHAAMRSMPVPHRPARISTVAPPGLCWTVFAALGTLPSAAHAAREHGRVAYVFDADTIRLDSGIQIRIVSIDRAETRVDRTKCAREIPIGKAQTERVQSLLDGRRVSYQVAGRNRDRLVAKVWVGRRDLVELLIEMGAARPWPRGRPKPG